MRLLLRIAAVALMVPMALGTTESAAAEMKKSTCRVCVVKHGEAEEEAVKAVRTHDGKEYGFCSEECAEAFAADPVAYLPPTFPRPAPAFALTDLAGRPVSNESLKGKVVLLDFWATWCVPCRKSMPELQVLHDKYRERGFSVVGVSIDEGGSAKVRKYVASKKLSYPIAVDSGERPAWDAFRVKAVPAAFLLDRDGRVVAQWTGIPARAGDLEAKLAELLRVD